MSLKERLGFDKDPVFLIDGTAFLYRGFYAYPDLKRSDGTPTNAIFIVLRILFKMFREERPKFVGFFMDGRGPTFRHELYKEYKANRPGMPEPLAEQIEPLQRAVRLLGLKLEISDQVEADDCIASLARTFQGERPVVIVSGDKDLKQCLGPGVVLWDPGGKQEKLATLDDFTRETGLRPDQWPDYQALIGDSSDNIPGVPGIGPKTADTIMRDFPTLEDIRDNFDALPKTVKKKMEGELDNIFLYRELTRMRADCLPDAEPESFRVGPVDGPGMAEFLREFEFRSLARELNGIFPETAGTVRPPSDQDSGQKSGAKPGPNPGQEQLTLFGDAPQDQDPAAPLEIRRASDPEQLPDMNGRDVGIVAEDGKVFLGIGGEEWAWSGDLPGLVERLNTAARVAAPDMKALLRADPAWGTLAIERWFDLGLAAYLLSPEDRNYSFERLARGLANTPEAAEVHPDAKGLAALELMRVMDPKIEHAELSPLMRTLEIPLIPVLKAMEDQGVGIDREAFAAYLKEVNARLDGLTRDIYSLAGEEFNIRSSRQMGDVLYKKLKLKPSGKTSGGQLSTAVGALEKLQGAHPVIEKILEYRKQEKLRSTYLAPMPELADARGRIHSTFNQLATATGRLSSSNPNLQNIPIRGAEGPRMRACFTAAPGNLLVGADYSQIELRVLAHFSKDAELLAAFAADEDIHTRTAALLFEARPEDVTPDQRRNAKTINFGLIYGMGPQKLAADLGLTLNEAKAFIERYFEKLGGLKRFYETVVEEARENGFVTTLAGRRRLLPEIVSRNQQLVSQARRQAINTVIQGSAADIIKLAMLAVHGDQTLRDLSAPLILQVHDELLLETPRENSEKAALRLRDIMQNVYTLDVPLKVDMGTGDNWSEAHQAAVEKTQSAALSELQASLRAVQDLTPQVPQKNPDRLCMHNTLRALDFFTSYRCCPHP